VTHSSEQRTHYFISSPCSNQKNTIRAIPTTSLPSTYSNTLPNQNIKMPIRSSRRNKMVETRTTKPTLMTRLKGRNAKTQTVKTTTTIEPRSEAIRHNHHNHTTGATGTRTTRSSRWGGSSRRNEPVVHHKRHASVGDKISGAMMKLKGSLTRRPGVKVSFPFSQANAQYANENSRLQEQGECMELMGEEVLVCIRLFRVFMNCMILEIPMTNVFDCSLSGICTFMHI